jgi:hypothetical protein
MTQFRRAALDHAARRWLRPDWRRFFRPGSQNDPLYQYYERIERKYDPNQPRVPAGTSEGGQWTSGEGIWGRLSGVQSTQRRTRVANVIWICVASGRSLSVNLDTGLKSYSVTYDCADGRSITRTGAGHSFPGLIRDPSRR